ncbi:MAG: hypothetical protein V4772_18810 [Pseudomonadota bacterium]
MFQVPQHASPLKVFYNANGSASITCRVLGITPQTVFYTIQLELKAQSQLTQRRMAFGAT